MTPTQAEYVAKMVSALEAAGEAVAEMLERMNEQSVLLAAALRERNALRASQPWSEYAGSPAGQTEYLIAEKHGAQADAEREKHRADSALLMIKDLESALREALRERDEARERIAALEASK